MFWTNWYTGIYENVHSKYHGHKLKCEVSRLSIYIYSKEGNYSHMKEKKTFALLTKNVKNKTYRFVESLNIGYIKNAVFTKKEGGFHT